MQRSYTTGLTLHPDSPIDLQTHTELSDGAWTPEALIDHFVREGFAAAAITDHDRLDTMTHIQRIALERGFPLVVAAEMTTRWRNQVVDILCFGVENNPAPLQALCDRVRDDQTQNSRKVYENLVSSGHIPRHNAEELAAILSATTSKQPYLLFDVFAAFNPQFGDDITPMNEAGYRLCTNETAAVVDAVHQCGGVTIIAHPGRTDGFATFDQALLDEFRAEMPIDGIEVYYPKHTPERTALYAAYAEQHGWLISAGSDSHTPDKPPIKYRADQCKALLARLEIKVGS